MSKEKLYYYDYNGVLRDVEGIDEVDKGKLTAKPPLTITEKEVKEKGLKVTPTHIAKRMQEYRPYSDLIEAIAENDQEAIKAYQEHNAAVKAKYPAPKK